MRRGLWPVVVFVAGTSAAVVALVGGCGGRSEAPAEGPLTIVASIFPLADVARQIGGEDVTVTTLLPPGETPHGFQPKPRQVEAVAQARLLLTVGLGMDLWADRAAEASGNKGITILELGAALKAEPIKVEPHGAEEESHPAGEHLDAHEQGPHEHAHEAGDPHMWLDPVLMQAYVQALAETLIRIDPAHAAGYRVRHEAYRAQLEDLHAAYRRTLATARRKAFVSFHSAFTYTAARYGLSQEAVFEVGRGGVGPKHLEQVVQFMRDHGIRVLFAEPQFPADRLQALVEATGATVRTLDPLGNPHLPGHDSYLGLMRTNLAVLAEALEASDVTLTTQPAP